MSVIRPAVEQSPFQTADTAEDLPTVDLADVATVETIGTERSEAVP
jgi:hypothetical protein